MKFLVFFTLVGLVLAKRFDGDQVLTLYPSTDEHLNLIKSFSDIKADFWKPDNADSVQIGTEVDIRFEKEYTRNVKNLCVKSGLDYKVKIFDVQRTIDGQFDEIRTRNMEDFPYTNYHTAAEIEQWAIDIAATHQDIIKYSVLGKSSEGRNINALTIGISHDNPLVVIDCGIHGREWISPATCLCYVDHLLHELQHDNVVANLMRSLTFVIIPVANPDGYEYTWTDDRMWRKTRSNYGDSCSGVDVNRNFDANWAVSGSSSDPCSETYHGPSVASEPATQALANLITSNSDRLKMYISLQSYGQKIVYPYMYANKDVANKDEHNKIFTDAAAAITSVHGKTYTGGAGYEAMYLASGTSSDFAIDSGADLSFAIELRDEGQYGFLLPESQIMETCEEISAGLDSMLNNALNN